MGQRAATLRSVRAARRHGGHERHHRMANAQPVSRMVEIHDVVDVKGASMEAPTDQQLIDFVIHEARLIDQHRLDEWLHLFPDERMHWMPPWAGAPGPN